MDLLAGVPFRPAGGATLNHWLLAKACLFTRVNNQVFVVSTLAGGDLEGLCDLNNKN